MPPHYVQSSDRSYDQLRHRTDRRWLLAAATYAVPAIGAAFTYSTAALRRICSKAAYGISVRDSVKSEDRYDEDSAGTTQVGTY